MFNPVEWAAWLHGRFFTAYPPLGYLVSAAIFAAIALLVWARGVEKYNAEHPPAIPAAVSVTAALSDAERPWVTVASVTSPEGIVIGKPAGVIVRYVNNGRSAALRIVSRARVDTLPAGMKPTFSYQDIEVGGSIVLGPGGEAMVALNPVRTPDGRSGFLQKVDFDALMSGARVFFVHGRVTYTDTAGCDHWTDFCYRLLLGGNLNFQWNAYTEHNDVDRGCKDSSAIIMSTRPAGQPGDG